MPTVKREYRAVIVGVCLLCSCLEVTLRADENSILHSYAPKESKVIDLETRGVKGFIIKPVAESTGPHEWVWFAPVIFSKNIPNERQVYIFGELVKRGVWIAGVDIGESYGNPAGVTAYNGFYDEVMQRFNLSTRPSVLAQSRGALMIFNWAINNPTKLRSIGAIYPVVNLCSWPSPSDPLFSAAARAYGMPRDGFQKQCLSLSPITNLKELALNHVPTLSLHGSNDSWVPLNQNSGALAEAYGKLGGTAKVVVIQGKGHEEADEFFTSKELIDFLVRPTITSR